jgi:hypothetical protein
MGEEFACAPDTRLHFVENQQEAMLVAQLAQTLQALRRHRTDTALALDRLNEDGARLGANGFLQSLMIAERHLIKAFDLGAETVEIFLLATGGNGRQRAAMESAFKSDDAEFFRMAVRRLLFARHFDRAFHRLRTRIGEEDEIRERPVHKTLRKLLAFGNLEQV